MLVFFMIFEDGLFLFWVLQIFFKNFIIIIIIIIIFVVHDAIVDSIIEC